MMKTIFGRELTLSTDPRGCCTSLCRLVATAIANPPAKASNDDVHFIPPSL
jgi:hypothetical protein